MTREELRDYVEEQRSLDMIPYHVYSTLIDGIDTLEQEPKTGHWINIDETHSKCDRCESVFEIASANGEANYCPNCGSRNEVKV